MSARHRRIPSSHVTARGRKVSGAAVLLIASVGAAGLLVSPASAALLDVPVFGTVQVPVDVPGITRADPGLQERSITTIDGLTITLQVAEQGTGSIPSVDLLSREGLVSTHLIARIDGMGERTDVSARLSTGYTVGYPIQFAPNGVSISVTTPQLTVSGGVNATVSPEVNISVTGGGGSLGSVGAEAGVEARLIPETKVAFDLNAGGAQDVGVAETWMTSPMAELVLGGTHVVVSNAFGPVLVRPYAVLTVTTANGVYDLPVYGNNTGI